jgi:putative membrane protein
LCDFVNIYELKIKIQKGAIMILLFLLSFSILPIILTFLEILFVKKNLKYKNIKYIRLLKIFELITPFIALIVSQGPRQVIGMTFLVFFFLSLTYFGILLYDVFKGKIDRNEFTINFVFYLVDIVLMFLSTLINVKIISLF